MRWNEWTNASAKIYLTYVYIDAHSKMTKSGDISDQNAIDIHFLLEAKEKGNYDEYLWYHY